MRFGRSKSSTPGPGEYNTNLTFGDTNHAPRQNSLGSTKKIGWLKFPKHPGPGEYDINRQLKEIGGLFITKVKNNKI